MSEATVLVVDNSPTIRKVAELTLKREQIRVLGAADGLSALGMVADEKPDLVILDIMLPRMDGYQICRIIRRNKDFKKLPIIMLSGKHGLIDRVRGRLAGATEYVTKPFDPAELVRVVRKQLARKQQRSQFAFARP
jgi:twitching motility two-component system response regulator PilG